MDAATPWWQSWISAPAPAPAAGTVDASAVAAPPASMSIWVHDMVPVWCGAVSSALGPRSGACFLGF
jgi:uncharacterized membrane protein YdfJ with MMPL/SSD domain